MDTVAASPCVLVTRPAAEAARWVDQLGRCGVRALALPLIDIGPAPDPEAVLRCRETLASFAAVMFVSVHAVQGLQSGGLAWPSGRPRAWAPGPGTAAALRAAGVPPELIDAPRDDAAQFDSETLWSQVQHQVTSGARVLIVRGADGQGRPSGREWLSRQLRQSGAQVHTVSSYSRRLPIWEPPQRELACAACAAGHWWLFSSSEAIANLGAWLHGQDWSECGALCTHPRIADAARRAGFGRVAEVRPTLEAIVAFLQSQP